MYGNIRKDHRKVKFGPSMDIEEADVHYDLCAAIEHLGNESKGHYLCAKRNFIVTTPFVEEKDNDMISFKYTNWNLISDESRLCL